MKPTLILMMGPSGCGKSYFAKKIEETHEDCIIVSRDKIRFALLEENDDYFAKEDQVLRQFYYNINFSLQNHKYVVADATHLTKKARKQFFRNVNTRGVRVVGVWVEVPLVAALSQNSSREGRARIPDDVVVNMFKRKISPQEDEPFNEVLYISPHEDIALGKVSQGIESVVEKIKSI